MIFRVTNQIDEEIFESRCEIEIETYQRELIERLNKSCREETPYTIEDDTIVQEIEEDYFGDPDFINDERKLGHL